MSRFVFRLRKFLAQKVLHTDDSPHTIALGASLAMLVAISPLIGLQTVIAVGLAALFRANKAICIPIVWIVTNPFTFLPIYGACYKLGQLVVGDPTAHQGAAFLTWLGQQPKGNLWTLAFWKDLLNHFATLGLELWVGCLIAGMVAGLGTYFLARWGVLSYRERRRTKILKRNLFRAQCQQDKITRRSEPALGMTAKDTMDR